MLTGCRHLPAWNWDYRSSQPVGTSDCSSSASRPLDADRGETGKGKRLGGRALC